MRADVTLRDEILEQPDVIARQLARGDDGLDALAAEIRARRVDSVVIAARGTSDHAAIYAQYLFGTLHRIPVALAAPSVLSIYGVAPRFARALVIGISQSGASPDIVGIVEAAQAQGSLTLAITNEADSALARAAEHVIPLDAGPELAIAATKTYTASNLAVARLAASLLEPDARDDARRAMGLLASSVAEALATEPLAAEHARALASADRLVVLGRGYEYATAREWGLKLKELAHVFADPYSVADFQHGPVALVEPGVPVLAVVPSGAAAAGAGDFLRSLRAVQDADLLVLSDDPDIRSLGQRSLPLPAGTPEWLRPVTSIIPAQLFAYHLTIARGLDPDSPRGLSKVTLTR
jgi:glucosamine--fructose-6-phosphate aminotransferase (isomerizing)